MNLRTAHTTVLLAVALTVGGAHAESTNLVVDYPEGAGPFPAVVMAPGQGYHLALPAMSESAKALVQHGCKRPATPS